jgi:hypothetical protein
MALLTKNISFCDAILHNVVSSDYKELVLHELRDAYDVSIVRKHHTRLDVDSLQRIHKLPHLVCLRSNGNPYLLYLTRHNMKNIAVWIDKKIQTGYTLPRMVVSPFQFKDPLFEGTVLDGEMIKDRDNRWVFLVNDIFAHRGRSLRDAQLPERLSIVSELLRNDFRVSGNDVAIFQMKRFFRVTEVDTVVNDFAPTLPYTHRGLLFKPLYRKFTDVLYNFDDTLVRHAPRIKLHKGTVMSKDDLDTLLTSSSSSDALGDVAAGASTVPPSTTAQPTPASSSSASDDDDENRQMMRIFRGTDPDVYRVLAKNQDQGTLHVKDLAQSLTLRSIFLNRPVNRFVEIPCEFSPRFGKWQATDVGA